MRFEGVVKTWNDDRGFGFIEPAQGGQDVFVHVKAIARSGTRLAVGQPVSFEVEVGPQGKKRARNVEVRRLPRTGAGLSQRASRPVAAQWGTATLFVIPAFLLVFAAVSILWRPPLWVAAAYVTLSAIAFMAYAMDKAAARSRAWRVSERTLHGLAVLGGWPGALIAQQALRHKSAKTEFRSVFWCTVFVNVVAFIVLCSPWGRAWLTTRA